jgi:hydrogenase-4 component F
MLLLALLLLPAVAGLASFAIKADGVRRKLLVVAAAGHAALVVVAWVDHPAPLWGGRLALDAPGLLVLSLASLLFLATSTYAVEYLRRERHEPVQDFEEGDVFTNQPEAVFTACLLLFLSTMTLVAESQHLSLLWVAVEATTLASAPLIGFHRHHRSLEATWKYLLICSVGIALALLGTFFVGVAASGASGEGPSLLLGDLLAAGPALDARWLRAAFVLFLVGYGTKMGLAPMHTWLPDAHAEAPSAASALLSGALLNCAFLGILRSQQVLAAAGQAEFGRGLLVLLGLFSMAVAAVFILGQSDYKRMLAYSSVEHMGILALGVGLGGGAVFGAMYHALNHTLAKGGLFLLSGNVLRAFRTKSTALRGMVRVLPVTGVLWVAGMLAITGWPPFGTFMSEFTVLRGALDGGRPWVAGLFLALLATVFLGMGRTMLSMAQGQPEGALARHHVPEPFLSVAAPAVLLLLALLFGLALPGPLREVLDAAARAVGGP